MKVTVIDSKTAVEVEVVKNVFSVYTTGDKITIVSYVGEERVVTNYSEAEYNILVFAEVK